jgi:hypothetical protein
MSGNRRVRGIPAILLEARILLYLYISRLPPGSCHVSIRPIAIIL